MFQQAYNGWNRIGEGRGTFAQTRSSWRATGVGSDTEKRADLGLFKTYGPVWGCGGGGGGGPYYHIWMYRPAQDGRIWNFTIEINHFLPWVTRGKEWSKILSFIHLPLLWGNSCRGDPKLTSISSQQVQLWWLLLQGAVAEWSRVELEWGQANP